MLREAREGRAGRLAAVLVAVALTGAPRTLALHAPGEAHPCACRARSGGERACRCALCRHATLAAQAADEHALPCHRAAARRALASRDAHRSPQGACLEETCGGSARRVMTLAAAEPFCAPASALGTPIRPPERRPATAPSPRDRPIEPETPPPRRA